MSRLARLILGLLAGLALLTWVASGVVETTAREWFERDVSARAHLFLTGANPSLAQAWNNPQELHSDLVAIARDEHVMATAACGADLSTRAATAAFPVEFDCVEVGPRMLIDAPRGGAEQPSFREWSTIATLPTGRVHVSAMPVRANG